MTIHVRFHTHRQFDNINSNIHINTNPIICHEVGLTPERLPAGVFWPITSIKPGGNYGPSDKIRIPNP